MNGSVLGDGTVAADFATLSPGNWTAEGHVIDLWRGADVYETYCATCHGFSAQGDCDGSAAIPSWGPAPLPAGLPINYVFWRVWDGVPKSVMPPFARYLSDEDVWNVVMYTMQLAPAAQPASTTP